MGDRGVDLFDDAPWPAEAPAGDWRASSFRPVFAASLVLVVLLLASQGLPWFDNSEVRPLQPLSQWLGGGWSPGTREWGILLLVLGVAVAVTLAVNIAVRTPRNALLGLLLLLATANVPAVAVEAAAHPAGGAGPNFSAGYVAWVGVALAVFAWIGVAVGTVFALADRLEARRRRPPALAGGAPRRR